MALDLEAFYRENHRLVRWIVRTAGVPSPAVDDVVQDVFVSAHRRGAAVDEAERKRWIMRVAKTMSYNHRRGAKRRGRRDGDWHGLWGGRVEAVDEVVDRRRDLERLTEALEQMGEPQRDVFIMIELAGMTAAEVAQTMGVSPNTVASRLRLAKAKLRSVPCSVVEEVRRQEPSEERVRSVWMGVAVHLAGAAPSASVLGGIGWALAGVVAIGTGVATRAITGPAFDPVDASRPVRAAAAPLQTDEPPRPLRAAEPVTAAAQLGVHRAEPPASSTRRADGAAAANRSASVEEGSKPRRGASSRSPTSKLAEEAALLRRAAEHLDRGALSAAAAALRAHARRFPRGVLHPERTRLQAAYEARRAARTR